MKQGVKIRYQQYFGKHDHNNIDATFRHTDGELDLDGFVAGMLIPMILTAGYDVNSLMKKLDTGLIDSRNDYRGIDK